MKALRLSDAARQDMVDAALWYAQQRRGLEDNFIREVEDMLFRIASHPEMFPCVHGDLHRALVRRFPYSVIFVNDADSIGVIAIVHTSRDPSVWKRRL